MPISQEYYGGIKVKENIKNYQVLVDESIRSVGGYWRSISALARLAEEIGELGELLLEKELDYEEVSAEMGDIFVISTCIANQYLSELDKEYKSLGFKPTIGALSEINLFKDVPTAFFNLSKYTGRIARIINHYEGDKVKKPSEIDRSIGSEVSKLHINLIALANLLGIEIFVHIKEVLSNSIKRDKDRFSISHDPITEISLNRFKSTVDNTHCIFSNTAKIWGSYEWDSNLSLEENIDNSLPSLTRFSKCADTEGLDGYVIDINEKHFTKNIEGLGEALLRTLTHISKNDPKSANSMGVDLHDPDWQFSYHGVRYFITTFSPIYEKNHPRHTPFSDSVFIFLQPEFSFDHHGIHSGNEKREDVKEAIRTVFKKNGCPYSVDLVKQPIEAFKYLKPETINGEPITWWNR
jgi:NTP pyrophosphatase (non-canonical NTP hydrolase)